MSGLRHHEYKRHRDRSIRIVGILRDLYQSDVYFAGENIETTSDFDDPKTALLMDWLHLIEADKFILYYPDRVQSSVLIELGAALALQKPCICLVRSRTDLPFLVRSASEIEENSNFPKVDIVQHNDFGSLVEYLNSEKLSALDNRKGRE
jgi:hypothetical protein